MAEVTVILTSYNHEKFLREAIESVLSQTFSDFELVIFDDASNDSSWDIIKSFSDSRIRAVRNKSNKGRVYIHNEFISDAASADLIAIHHSDDAWEKDKLKEQVAFLKEHPGTGGVFTNAAVVDERGRPLKDGAHPYLSVFSDINRGRREWLNYFFYRGNALCHPSLLIRKKCYRDCGLYRLELLQLDDFDMWVRLCLKHEIHILPEKLVRFRLRDNEANSSGNRPEAVIRISIENYEVLKNYLLIDDCEEMFSIFPQLEKYRRKGGGEPRFLLAMAALGNDAAPWTNLFGLDLLYGLFKNPADVEKINSLYGFGYKDLIELSGKYDVFSNLKLVEKEMEIASIRNSRSWRVTRPLRRAASFFGRARSADSNGRSGNSCPHPPAGYYAKLARAYRRGGAREIARAARRAFRSRGNDYDVWIRRYDILTEEGRLAMRACVSGMRQRPLISVIMPVYNAKEEWLVASIDSVRNQIYPDWELCIADDASSDENIREIISRCARDDSRVKAVFREHNGHISEASNSAAALAAGEWAVLLDQDDLLSEDALYRVAEAIQLNPDAGIIYSDEDKIDESGRRSAPYFKSEWNRDLFYSHNLISHLGAYRMSLLRDAGGFRKGFEGAQDYDLALRCLERISDKQIVHIPYVLYHWRMHPGSTASSLEAKPYATVSAERALNEHLGRMNVDARAESCGPGYRVRYKLPEDPPAAALVILTRDEPEMLRRCVGSVLDKTDYPDFEILIVDNGSSDPAALECLRSLSGDPRIRVLRDDRPFNFSALNNAAVKSARGDIICLLNNDTEIVSECWLSEMVSIAIQPGAGAVGAQLWYPDGTLQHGGVLLGVGGVAGHAHRGLPGHSSGYFGRAGLINSFSAVTAACLVVRKSVYEEAGGMNEEDLKVDYNDVDFCLRLREAGYRNVYTPYARLIHLESASRGRNADPAQRPGRLKEAAYMKERWGNLLLNDPAYSPNLTLDYGNFSLAWPPRVVWRGKFEIPGAGGGDIK